MLSRVNMFKKEEMRHFEYSNKGFLSLYKVRMIGGPGQYGGSKPYVAPSSPVSGPNRGGGGGGSAPSTPSSGTVYIYKGKEYTNETDVKNAIASDTLGSPKVQEILKKQGGSSETVYVYGGSTYTSPSEVQAQIQKKTTESPQVQTIMATQQVVQPKSAQPVGMQVFTSKPFSSAIKESEDYQGFMKAPASLSLYNIDQPSNLVSKPSKPLVVSGKPKTLKGKAESFIGKAKETELKGQKIYGEAKPWSKEKAWGATGAISSGIVVGATGTAYGIVSDPFGTITAPFKPSTYKELWSGFKEAPLGTLSELGGSALVFEGIKLGTKPVAKGLRYAVLEKPLRETSLSRDLAREPFIRERASIIIKEEGTSKVLFTKEKAGFSRLPGGAIEKGEKPLVAAKRELYEETGLKGLKLKKTDIVTTSTEKHYVFEAKVPKISELNLNPQKSELSGFFTAKVSEGYQPTLTKPLGQKASIKGGVSNVFKPEIRSDDLFIASRSFAVEKVSKKIGGLSPVERESLGMKAKSWAVSSFGEEKTRGISSKSLMKDYMLSKEGMLFKSIIIPSKKAGNIRVGLESRYKVPFSRQREYAGKEGVFIHGAPTAELTESPILGIPKDIFKKSKRISPIEYAKQSKEFNFEMLSKEKFVKRVGKGGKTATGVYREAWKGQKPEILIRKDFPKSIRKESTAHEVIHSKTPDIILKGSRILPYKYRPSEMLAYGLEKKYAKEGFKVKYKEGIPIKSKERGGAGLYFQPPSYPRGEAYVGVSYLGLEAGKTSEGGLTFKKSKPTAYFMKAKYGEDLFPTSKAMAGTEFEVARKPGTKIVSKYGRERFYLGGKSVGVQELRPFGLEEGKIPKGFKEMPKYDLGARYVSPYGLGIESGMIFSSFKGSKSKTSYPSYKEPSFGYKESGIGYFPSEMSNYPKEKYSAGFRESYLPKYISKGETFGGYDTSYGTESNYGFSIPKYGYTEKNKGFKTGFTTGFANLPTAKGTRPKESPLVKSRPYRYTPNLIGIEFGRALKKTPKGSKVWSGFELRPLVGGF